MVMDDNELRYRILKIVEDIGIGVIPFCNSISVSKSSYYNWIKGKASPAVDSVVRLFKIYPVYNPNWLLFGEGEMKLPKAKPQDVVEEPTFNYGDRPLKKSDLSKILKKLADEIDKV
jgi:hypothetical protein